MPSKQTDYILFSPLMLEMITLLTQSVSDLSGDGGDIKPSFAGNNGDNHISILVTDRDII